MYLTTMSLRAIQGGDVTRAGTRTAAKGTVAGTSKKALGEALDSQIADLKKDDKDKKPKDNKEKNPKDPKKEETKQLQKDIKAFLINELFETWIKFLLRTYLNTLFLDRNFNQLRLRDKSQKARELALDLSSLGVPHQEAYGFLNQYLKTYEFITFIWDFHLPSCLHLSPPILWRLCNVHWKSTTSCSVPSLRRILATTIASSLHWKRWKSLSIKILGRISYLTSPFWGWRMLPFRRRTRRISTKLRTVHLRRLRHHTLVQPLACHATMPHSAHRHHATSNPWHAGRTGRHWQCWQYGSWLACTFGTQVKQWLKNHHQDRTNLFFEFWNVITLWLFWGGSSLVFVCQSEMDSHPYPPTLSP